MRSIAALAGGLERSAFVGFSCCLPVSAVAFLKLRWILASCSEPTLWDGHCKCVSWKSAVKVDDLIQLPVVVIVARAVLIAVGVASLSFYCASGRTSLPARCLLVSYVVANGAE